VVGVESGVVEFEEFEEPLLPGVESGDVLVFVLVLPFGLELPSAFAFGLVLPFGFALVFGLVLFGLVSELLGDEESDPSALLLSPSPLSPSDPWPVDPWPVDPWPSDPWPAALCTWCPARSPRPSRRPSAIVCGVFLIWSTAASAPVLTVWPRSMLFWAPKLTLRDWVIRSVIIASRAEIAGSFIASTTASIRASLSSLRIRRTISLVACVIPATPSSDRPNVKGAAACAAMISAARIASCTITAALPAITMAAAASSTPATTRATVWASSR
jgi:hypothetical protein